MGRKVRLLRCPVCDTVVDVLDHVGMDLVCCGPSMIPLETQSARPGTETHLPVVHLGPEGLKVCIGAQRHPMDDDHYIEWVEVGFDGMCMRQFFEPGQVPETTFEMYPRDRTVMVQAYCNVHGLWRSVEKLTLRRLRRGTGRQIRIDGQTAGFLAAVSQDPEACIKLAHPAS